ncbi:MAG: Gmad2 immunoglobulin-like domain-containing protein, partial [Candidatus Pacebacteria bacterium]|nr:Gmad2 immunoglobulin-like domain-containing protein [Candidatus Paceibacterota bacterium]
MKKIFNIILIILIGAALIIIGLNYNKSLKKEANNSSIIINTPLNEEEVISPVIISGEAKGSWFFEGTFPIKIYDENNNLLGQGIAEAKDDWMTENFIPFEAQIDFNNSGIGNGWIVLEKDNPSGIIENTEEARINVRFKNEPQREISLYYYNPSKDNQMCSKEGLVQVKREIPTTMTPIQDTIKLLLKGELTHEEV